MGTLTGNKIKDTYDGLLKTNDSTTGLPATGKTLIEDGLGNDSALALGRANEGATITGKTTTDVIGDVYASDSNRVLNNGGTGGLTATFRGNILASNGDTVLENGTSQTDATFKGNVLAEDGSNIIQSNATGGDGTFGGIFVDQIEAKTNPQGSATNGEIEVSSAVKFNENLRSEGSLTIDSEIRTTGGDIIMEGSANKLGVRTTSPTAALDVNGTIKTNSLNVNSKHLLTYTSQLTNKKTIQMVDYGGYNINGNLAADTQIQVPKTTSAFSGNGNLVEDCRYYYIRLTPSFWSTNQDQNNQDYYADRALFTPTDGNEFIYIEEILYIDNKVITAGNFSGAQRGGFQGTDDDIYLSIFTQVGADVNRRQICSIPLGTYRNENLKWSFIQRSNEEIQNLNNFKTPVQRAGATVYLRSARLNVFDSSGNFVGPTRPTYNALLRLKIRRFKAGSMFSSGVNQQVDLVL